MGRELWLLRHAKAERNLALDDFDRPLKKRGKRAAERLGSWLRQQRLLPDWIVSSPAKRAVATAKAVHKAMAVEGLVIAQDKRLYQEGYECLKAVLAECPVNAKRVMLVGHNPDLEDLLVHLVGVDHLPDTDKLLPTATLVRLMVSVEWVDLGAGCATLLSITNPKSLLEEGAE
ncbi:MAG: histidine phosphatase family protein [Methylococcales bacterium]|nr:histidine phosphatase family protein [Methylococcales bacterium]